MKGSLDFYLISLIPLYIAFIFLVGVRMLSKRLTALKKKEIRFSYFKSYSEMPTTDLLVSKNNFDNHFQVPILFFITCLSAVQLQVVTIITLIFGYSFFISRVIHSFIHLGSNNVKYRAMSFFFGFFCVCFMWIQIICSGFL